MIKVRSSSTQKNGIIKIWWIVATVAFWELLMKLERRHLQLYPCHLSIKRHLKVANRIQSCREQEVTSYANLIIYVQIVIWRGKITHQIAFAPATTIVNLLLLYLHLILPSNQRPFHIEQFFLHCLSFLEV